MAQYDIEALLEEVVTLPSMPTVVEHITHLLGDPNCSIGEVAKAVSSDPAIALKTLRLVNSAYYGLGQEVTSVEHAVALLGIKVIKNLVLTASVFDTINNTADRFVRHCVSCGVAMRILAEHGPLAQRVSAADEAFIFGLLHDIGKVILGEFLPDEYVEIQRIAEEEGKPWYLAEHEVIGVDHGAVGASLAQKWKLSPSVIAAIGGHHDLGVCQDDTRMLAATLTVGDYLCSASGFAAYPNAQFEVPDAVWNATGLNNKALAKIANCFFDSLPNIEELVKLAA